MSILTPNRRHSIGAPSPAPRDRALADLYACGDRLLALHRASLETTVEFASLRDAAVSACSEYREALRAFDPSTPWQPAINDLPGWPTLTAGTKLLTREVSGRDALRFALTDQVRAEENWKAATHR